ncbi:lysophospholipid acyltransferase family protein [Thalassorhabdus alkalitolerans]|uniref:Lysophospholipid acyltransferase family protein n=1 Tax=Thalassorhabdus alkalitolerans TaxID=2282697 RepID=A0ABW0YGL7_9BACI
MFYTVLKFIAKVIIPLRFSITITGRENVPEDGPVILSSNHINFFDPVFLGILVKRDIHFLAKIELFSSRLTRSLMLKLHTIPVNRQSGNAIRPVRRALKLLEEGQVVGIFPEGTRIPTGKRVEPAKGVGFFGVKTGVPIVPVGISIYKKKNSLRKKVTIHIGSPIEVSTLETDDYREVARLVMDQSRELAWHHPETALERGHGRIVE